MGTSNFANRNAKNVYAVCMNEDVKFSNCSECNEKHYGYDEDYIPEGVKDCPECGEVDCIQHDEESRARESWEYDDEAAYFKEQLEASPLYVDRGEDDRDRNYYGRCLGSFSKSKIFGDIEIEIRVAAMLRSAYYEGANLDYNDPEIYTNGNEGDINDMEGEFHWASSDMNEGMKKIQARNAAKWADKALSDIVDSLEAIYTAMSTPLVVVARFSNGETMYQKAS